MLRIAVVALLLAASLATAQVREKRVVPVESGQRMAFEGQGKVAVVAGVGDYPRASGLSSLRYPAADAGAVAAALEARNYTVVSLAEDQATRAGILRAIRNAGEVLERGQGTLVFFFSGHGFAVGGTNYLATYGASALNLSQTGLALDELERQMRDTGVARRMMWIDACRRPAEKSGAEPRSFAAFQAAEGTRVLFSTRVGRVSYENDDLRQGVFTHFLLQGLRGGAAGADGLLTFRDLADYVESSVRSYSLQRGDVQVPYDAGEAAGDFLIARVGAGDSGPARIAPPDSEAAKPAAGALLISTDTAARISIDGEDCGTLAANQAKRFTAMPGSHIVVATSTEQSSLTERKIAEVRRDEQQAVLIEFAADLEQARRQAAAEREAAERQAMVGTWAAATWEGDTLFSNGSGRFHGRMNFSAQIAEDGDGFRMVFRDSRAIDYLDRAGGFTREVEATFHLRREGNSLTGYVQSAHMRDDPGASKDLPGVSFTFTITDPLHLAFRVVWQRDSDGKELNWWAGTLQKQ
jgi:uncharacterized caspase-like protein